jgi:uncharacterized protein
MPDPHQIMFYVYVDDILERRPPYREAHVAKIAEGKASGAVVMAGPLNDPPTGAVIVFKGDDPAVAEEFANADPYVQAGLVTDWHVDLWNVV